jgi:secreted PhoX family phosphatase
MDDDAKRSAAHGLAAADDVPTNPRAAVVATIGDVIDRCFGCRGALKALLGTADGVWAVETECPSRGAGRMFFRAPVGAEMYGPCFTPDDRALFVAVQHVAMDGVENYAGFGRASTFEDPATRWPDFDPAVPPRPSVIAITRDDGGPIGG